MELVGDDVEVDDSFIDIDNASEFDINITTGLINFTPNSTGANSYLITCCDDSGELNNCSNDTFSLSVNDIFGLIVVKNIYYVNHTTSNITYRVDATVYNFAGSNLTNITVIDPDALINNTFNLSHQESYSVSKNMSINMTASSQIFLYPASRAGSTTSSCRRGRRLRFM